MATYNVRIDHRPAYAKPYVVQERLRGKWVDSVYCETHDQATRQAQSIVDQGLWEASNSE